MTNSGAGLTVCARLLTFTNLKFNIMGLEQILQEYFGCKRPFDKDGKLTKHGDIAVQRLISLLHDLNAIGVINGSWNAEKRIDDIIDND